MIWPLLRTRRWLGFTAVVVGAIIAFGLLSQWQWSRAEERRGERVMLQSALAAEPVPLDAVDPGMFDEDEWRTVSVRGEYLARCAGRGAQASAGRTQRLLAHVGHEDDRRLPGVDQPGVAARRQGRAVDAGLPGSSRGQRHGGRPAAAVRGSGSRRQCRSAGGPDLRSRSRAAARCGAGSARLRAARLVRARARRASSSCRSPRSTRGATSPTRSSGCSSPASR